MPGVPRKSLPDALGAYRGGKPCLHVAATARPAKAETGTRQATAVKIRREKNRTFPAFVLHPKSWTLLGCFL